MYYSVFILSYFGRKGNIENASIHYKIRIEYLYYYKIVLAATPLEASSGTLNVFLKIILRRSLCTFFKN